MREIPITEQDAGRRLDRFLNRLLPVAGTGFLYKMLRKKNITLNNAKAAGTETLEAGDVVRIWFSDETYDKFSGRIPNIGEEKKTETKAERKVKETYELSILFEDQHVIVIDKQAGLLSQKSAAEDISVNELLLEHLGFKSDCGCAQKIFRPSACHRLDRNTSGVLVCGKTYKGLKTMTDMIRLREVEKYYLCLVRGETPENFTLRDHLLKERGENIVTVVPEGTPKAKEAVLEAETLGTANGISLLRVRLVTGRSHQIRVQLAHAGHPLLGDPKYGDERLTDVAALPVEKKIKRPMLHAYALVFPEELTEEMIEKVFLGSAEQFGPSGTVTAPVPEDMKQVMKGAGIAWPPGIPED